MSCSLCVRVMPVKAGMVKCPIGWSGVSVGAVSVTAGGAEGRTEAGRLPAWLPSQRQCAAHEKRHYPHGQQALAPRAPRSLGDLCGYTCRPRSPRAPDYRSTVLRPRVDALALFGEGRDRLLLVVDRLAAEAEADTFVAQR